MNKCPAEQASYAVSVDTVDSVELPPKVTLFELAAGTPLTNQSEGLLRTLTVAGRDCRWTKGVFILPIRALPAKWPGHIATFTILRELLYDPP